MLVDQQYFIVRLRVNVFRVRRLFRLLVEPKFVRVRLYLLVGRTNSWFIPKCVSRPNDSVYNVFILHILEFSHS